jgi:hypothetical protein
MFDRHAHRHGRRSDAHRIRLGPRLFKEIADLV